MGDEQEQDQPDGDEQQAPDVQVNTGGGDATVTQEAPSGGSEGGEDGD